MFTKLTLYILLFVKTVSGKYQNLSVSIKNPIDSDFFHKILQNYNEFDLIMHVENATKQTVNGFLAKYDVPTIIFNHDLKNIKEMERPISAKCLNLILFKNPIRFTNFTKIQDNVYSTDVTIFLTTPPSFAILKENFKKIKNLSKFGLVMVIKFDLEGFRIYSTCFYCGQQTEKFFKYKSYQYGELNPTFSKLNLRDFKDLNQHLLKVVYLNYFPYFFCLRTTTKNGLKVCDFAIGSEFKLLKTLSKKLNFKFILIEAENSSYTNLIADLVQEKYDLAIGGVSVTNGRRKILQFSSVLRFENLVFMFVYRRGLKGKNNHLDLNFLLWRLGVIPVLAGIICVIGKCGHKQQNLSFLKIIRILARGAYEQPTKLSYFFFTHKIQSSICLLFMSWWFFSMMINLIYKSQLTSHLVLMPKAPLTLKELLKEGYNIAINRKLLGIYHVMLLNEEKFLLTEPTTIRVNHFCDLKTTIKTNKAIIVGEFAKLLYHSQMLCSGTLQEFTSQTFQTTAHALAFQTGIPFVPAFNKEIQQLMNAGLLTHWKRDLLITKKMLTYRPNFRHQRHLIHFDAFFVEFLFFLIALAVDVLIFLLEICYSKFVRTSKQVRP